MDSYTGNDLQLAAHTATVAQRAEQRRERLDRIGADPTERRRRTWSRLRLTGRRIVRAHHAHA